MGDMRQPARASVGLIYLPVEVLRVIVNQFVPPSIGWDDKLNYWPGNFIVTDEMKAEDEVDSTSFRDYPARKAYMANIRALTQLALTCRWISILVHEALYSRVRIDNWSALYRLTVSLMTQTDSMRKNAAFIKRLELDLDLETNVGPWLDIHIDPKLVATQGGAFASPPLGDEGIQRPFNAPIFSICPTLKDLAAQYRHHGFRDKDPAPQGLGPGVGPVVFFTMLCYLPSLQTLVLRYSEKNTFLHQDRWKLVYVHGLKERYYYQTVFELLSEAAKANLKAGIITPRMAPSGTWPCPTLKYLEAYGQPLPWDILNRAVQFTPGWTFHTIPGLRSLKVVTMSQNSGEDFPFESRAEHMRACMANLNHLELHSTFDLKVMSRALAEGKNLRSLSIQLDSTQVYYNQSHLFLNDGSDGKPNLNTILPLCASTPRGPHLGYILLLLQFFGRRIL
ncbi:hypothetical protein C7999DRAFT_32250 [Corynascus novoguineensis]|uniref:Uncharacterized protein n=1 Tax=Corynascus novoguineensis TaxID=1126955 RepID=A0AAN7CT52_9PEZI|nr:hypothetical protein C7999DRAFT_32250 [Corynascus novoguineensis]